MEQPNHDFDNPRSSNYSKFSNFGHWIGQDAQSTCNKAGAVSESKLSVPARRANERRNKISTNRLGGHYSTGRPLPMDIREKIVDLSKSGLKPCQISKQLRVSHGCVSKLLAKWRKTGTVRPEKIGGSRPKKVLPCVARAITVYKHYKPRLQSWQIKEYLIKDGVCNDGNVPSISSINKTLRNQKRFKLMTDLQQQQHQTGLALADVKEPAATEATASAEGRYSTAYDPENDQKIDFQPQSTSKWQSLEATVYPQTSCNLKIAAAVESAATPPPQIIVYQRPANGLQMQAISCGMQAHLHNHQQHQQQFFNQHHQQQQQQQDYGQYCGNYANRNGRYSQNQISQQETFHNHNNNNNPEQSKFIFEFDPLSCQSFLHHHHHAANLMQSQNHENVMYGNNAAVFSESLPESSHLSTFLDDVFI